MQALIPHPGPHPILATSFRRPTSVCLYEFKRICENQASASTDPSQPTRYAYRRLCGSRRVLALLLFHFSIFLPSFLPSFLPWFLPFIFFAFRSFFPPIFKKIGVSLSTTRFKSGLYLILNASAFYLILIPLPTFQIYRALFQKS